MKQLATFFLCCFVVSIVARVPALSVTTGSVTLTRIEHSTARADGLACVSMAWTSDNGGDVDAMLGGGTIHGTLERIVFKPGTGGDAPTNLYDLTLKDRDAFDIVSGFGGNLSSTVNSQAIPYIADGATTGPFSVAGALTLAIDNAGSTKTGTMRLFFRR